MAKSPQEHERLIDALRSLYAVPLDVPAEIDRAVLNRARAEMVRRRRWRPMLWAGGIAAAACVAVVALVWRDGDSSSLQQASAQVTIVDALKLARQIESGRGRDVNGDGSVDRRDVDALAMSAVRLSGSGQ